MEKRKTKILIMQDHDPLDGVSLSVATFGVASKLAALGFSVVFASPRASQSKIVKGVNVKKLELLEMLEAEVTTSDVVIPVVNLSAFFKPLGLTAIDFCEKLSKPCLPWVHTNISNAVFNNVAGVDDFSQRINIESFKNTLNKEICRKIVCVSKSVVASLKKIGVDDTKCEVVFNGIDLQKIAETGIGKKSFDIIFVGKFEPVKCVPLFLAAMKLVKTRIPGIKILMIGCGSDDKLVLSLIKALNLDQNIKIVPNLVNGKLLEMIASSKVLVSSSLSESFGLSLAEAMLLNTLVVAPNIEGPAEVLNNGRCGFLYNSADSGESAGKVLEALKLSGSKLKTMRDKANSYAKNNFDLDIKAKELGELINSAKTLI